MRGVRPTMTRKRRVDAEYNREHILDVARAAFAADGLDLPMREIARRVGVGVATVYRHFPSRQELVSAVLKEQVERCGEEMQAALTDPDPRHALRGVILRFGERQAQDRGLNEALFGLHSAGAAFADQRRAHAQAFTQLVQRARKAGVVRDQVSVQDARIALMAITSFRNLPGDRAQVAIRRLTDLLLAGVLNEEAPVPG
jgi:AcrR family transcriptional regulator